MHPLSKVAFRVRIGDKKQKADFSKPLEPRKNANDGDEMEAVWEDGDRWLVAGLSHKEWKERSGESKTAAKKSDGIIDQRDHHEDGYVQLINFTRTMKGVVVQHYAIMYKATDARKRMALQLVVKDFYVKPLDFMRKLFKKFCTMDFAKESMEQEKVEYITSQQEFKAKVVKKRPAAAMATSTSRPGKATSGNDGADDDGADEDARDNEVGEVEDDEDGNEEDGNDEGANKEDGTAEEPMLKKPVVNWASKRATAARASAPRSPPPTRAATPPSAKATAPRSS